MTTQRICVGVRSFRDSIESIVADGYDVVVVVGDNTTCTQSSSVVGQVPSICLRSKWQLLMAVATAAVSNFVLFAKSWALKKHTYRALRGQ